jgi:hypothetical protein
MSESVCEQLDVELQRLKAEGLKLTSEGQRLRTQLRRARTPAHIHSKLHDGLFSAGQGGVSDSRVGADSTHADEASSLHTRLQEAEAFASQKQAEVEELKRRLDAQEALQSDALRLMTLLGGRRPDCKDEGQANDESEPCGLPTAREAKLTRETVELRLRVRDLENKLKKAKAASLGTPEKVLGSGRATPLNERREARRLQQLNSVALRLHEELRHRAIAQKDGSKPPSAASSPPFRRGVGQAASLCGTSMSGLSTKSELLEKQIETFCKRFMAIRNNDAFSAQLKQ